MAGRAGSSFSGLPPLPKIRCAKTTELFNPFGLAHASLQWRGFLSEVIWRIDTIYHFTATRQIEGIPEGATVKDAREIVPESDIARFRNLANFSDWFRYNLLSKKGGWWSDTDSVCVKPLDFSSDCVFSSEVVRFATGPRGHTNCGNIKVPAGSEIMRWCVEQVQKTDTRTNTWSQIGPVLLKAAVEKFDLTKYIQDGYVFCPLGWQDCPEAFLSPIPPRINPQAYCIHLYNEMWSAQRLRESEIRRQRWEVSVYLSLLATEGPLFMKASIIIPCFNHSTYLKQCVDSALAQTHDDVEVIFVNDGSTDNSLEIARTYGNRIEIINESNKGVAAARNAGLMNSSGDFILPLDADDWISPAYLEKTLALMADSKVGVVSTHMDYNGAWSNDMAKQRPNIGTAA